MVEPAAESSAPGRAESLPMRALRAFGHFWWDFLVGETPELFLGGVAVIGLIALICLDPGLRTAAAFFMPIGVLAVLSVSVWRAARRRST